MHGCCSHDRVLVCPAGVHAESGEGFRVLAVGANLKGTGDSKSRRWGSVTQPASYKEQLHNVHVHFRGI